MSVLFSKISMIGMSACLFAAVILLTGCQRRDPQFEDSQRLTNLVPEAQQAVRQQLRHLYGTINSPRTPHWLPIDRGGEELVVETLEQESDQGSIVAIKLKSGSFQHANTDGMEIEEVVDPLVRIEQGGTNGFPLLAPLIVPVAGYDATTDRLKLSETLPVFDETESRFILSPHSRLLEGQRLYSRHCQLCHGVTGDGHGPQSQVLNPKPRDFRLGIFKYTSTQPGTKASDADLSRVIEQGIAGTGMPAFLALTTPEISAITEYVKYLALRGETEQQLCLETEIDFSQLALTEHLEESGNAQEREQERRIFQKELADYLREDFPSITYEVTSQLGDQWKAGNDPASVVTPTLPRTDPRGLSQADPTVKSLINGRRLYLSENLQCAGCHGKDGHGDGEQTRLVQKSPDGSPYPLPGLHDAWGQQVKPRDLSYGVFHGGRLPVDLFRRIAAGVKGTPMPAYRGKGLSDAELWDLVNYIYFLSGEYPDVSL